MFVAHLPTYLVMQKTVTKQPSTRLRSVPTRMTDKLMSVQEVADRLAVGERFVRRLIEERRIRYYKVGKYVRISESDLAEWLENCHQHAPLR